MTVLPAVLQPLVAAILAIAGALLTRGARSAVRQLTGLAFLGAAVWLLARAYLPSDVPDPRAAAAGEPTSFATLLILLVVLAAGFLLRNRGTRP